MGTGTQECSILFAFSMTFMTLEVSPPLPGFLYIHISLGFSPTKAHSPQSHGIYPMIFPNLHAFVLVLYAWNVLFKNLYLTKFGSSLEQRHLKCHLLCETFPFLLFSCAFLHFPVNFKFDSVVVHIILHLVMCLSVSLWGKDYVFSLNLSDCLRRIGLTVFLFVCLFSICKRIK